MGFEPIYFSDQLILGAPGSAVAVVTLWSKKEKVAAGIPREHFAVMGQLYSPTRGIDPLVRNLIANPSIRHLVVTGRDFSGSGTALADLFPDNKLYAGRSRTCETRQGNPGGNPGQYPQIPMLSGLP